MLYLNYAKQVAGIGYILNFFSDSEKDIEEVSGGKSFISNNGINYGAPLFELIMFLLTKMRQGRVLLN